jgi:hypothetical protein
MQQQRTSNRRAWPFGVSHIASTRPPASSAAAGITMYEVLIDYNEGRRSVQDIVQIANSYQGPAPHWLWATVEQGRVLGFVFLILSETKLFDLLQQLIDTDPALPFTTGNVGYGDVRLLDVVLGWARTGDAISSSSRVLLLLAVPGATRRPRDGSQHPLHLACSVRQVDPDVIHRLLDLDSDVLGLRDVRSRVPLHCALQMNPTALFVARMVELRPETLLFKDCTGHTPVSGALLRTDGSPSPQVASALLDIVSRHPGSVSLSHASGVGGTALSGACLRFHEHPDLIRGVVRACPQGLLVATDLLALQLPVDIAADHHHNQTLAAFVEEETVHIALAMIEYVLGGVVLAGDDQWFRVHARKTLQGFLPGLQLASAFGVSAAHALLQLDRPLDAVRALFCHGRAARLLRRDGRLRDVVLMGEAVLDLYKLNRLGGRLDTSKTHQVQLLASLKDSGTVESTYLHFRDVARHTLLGDRRSRATA